MDAQHSNTTVLDNAAWWSLTGAHAHLAIRQGAAARYRPEVAPFAGLADASDANGWKDLAELVGPNAVVAIPHLAAAPGPGWEVVQELPALQLVLEELVPGSSMPTVPLTDDDVPDMLDLVARTQPGPFLPRTIEFGGYLGIRRNGALTAMAGRRLSPPGFRGVSAVCTDPGHRKQGLASAIVRAVVEDILALGETPFLHVSASNDTARSLYETLGFRVRARPMIAVLRSPTSSPTSSPTGSPISRR